MEPCLPAFWREFYMGFECGRRNSSQSDQTGNYCLLPLQNTDDCGRTLRCHVITVLYGHFCRKLWYAGWGRLLWEETLCGWCLRRESETVWEPPTWLLLEESIELDGHPCMHRLLHGRGMWTGWPGPYNTRACRSIFSPLWTGWPGPYNTRACRSIFSPL